MASMKRGPAVASMFLLIAVMISACELPYSTPPAGTSTPLNPTSLFPSPLTPDLTNVGDFGTSTALALSGTPQAVATQTMIVGTQDLSASVTPTALSTDAGTTANPGSTALTATLALPTSAPVTSRPAEWTLRSGEFPYCIARRFDVDPSTLLSLNGLTDGNIFYPGRTLRIPQSGSFPGTRALRNHPGTYTVGSSTESVYSIACLYGDVRPEAIITANNLTGDNPTLTSGQSLTIP